MSKIIVANWKMNLDLKQSIKLAKEYQRAFKKPRQAIVVCPSEFALVPVRQVLVNSPIKLGAQNVSSKDNGAQTGEVSAKTLALIGCQYIIIGHSERRANGESCRIINAKIKAILKNKQLVPILCVGEDWNKRQTEKSQIFVAGQLKRALTGVKVNQEIIIAYEPIWAIGTGQVIKPIEAEIMHQYIKKEVTKILGSRVRLKVIYGGSVKPNNAKQLLKLDDIDGFLVGGASLKVNQFKKIASFS